MGSQSMRGGDPEVPNAHRVPEAANLGTHNEASESSSLLVMVPVAFLCFPWPNRLLLSYLPFPCTTISAEPCSTTPPDRLSRLRIQLVLYCYDTGPGQIRIRRPGPTVVSSPVWPSLYRQAAPARRTRTGMPPLLLGTLKADCLI
jgi:hypothetical protein